MLSWRGMSTETLWERLTSEVDPTRLFMLERASVMQGR